MRTSRFTNEQIVQALRQAESGTPAAEICRKLNLTETMFYPWTRRFAGLDVSEVRELKQLREENRKFKQLVADLSRQDDPARDADKKMVGPGHRRAAVHWARGTSSKHRWQPAMRSSGSWDVAAWPPSTSPKMRSTVAYMEGKSLRDRLTGVKITRISAKRPGSDSRKCTFNVPI